MLGNKGADDIIKIVKIKNVKNLIKNILKN